MTKSRSWERRAVIDVGTNSVKLIVADVGHDLKPVLKLSRQTRLGQGAFRTGRLQPEAIARTVAAVAELAILAAETRPVSLRILATCAARETANGQELIHAIARVTGVTVELLSGDQEADYIFFGVTSDPAMRARPILIVDVGGGSTEWILGEGGFTYFTQSTRLGTTRLLEAVQPGDPPTPEDLAHCQEAVTDFLTYHVGPTLRPLLAGFRDRQVCLIGLGGALKSLARLALAPESHSDAPIPLRLDQIREQIERLWCLSSQQRRNHTGLNPEKADVILAGAVIYEAVMHQFGFTELLASSQGLRTGALLMRPVVGGKPPRAVWHKFPPPPPPDMPRQRNGHSTAASSSDT